MSFLPKTYQTTHGNLIAIREANAEDARQLLALKLQYLKNTTTIPLFDYEYTNTIKEEEELINTLKEQSNSLLLVAENKGKIIGNIDLTGSQRKKMQHTAMIGMGIHTQWQNQGIGTLLIQNALDWSKENIQLHLIWLEVYATNIAGIALYKKMGLTISGCTPDFFIEKGKYIDKMTMTILVK